MARQLHKVQVSLKIKLRMVVLGTCMYNYLVVGNRCVKRTVKVALPRNGSGKLLSNKVAWTVSSGTDLFLSDRFSVPFLILVGTQ